MEYVYSALVLHAAGKTIDDDAIANVLRGAGMEPDPARIKAVTASLEGINIDEAIASAAVAPVAAAPAAAPAEETKEAPKEEEKKPEVSEEEAAAGLSALFD
ncbi:MAG: 50S ribosomal protein P1 [Methanomassiliicoccaceae archaeon]|jgi:large subunit ribosomal protein L12|nr:50S ribosomal protein P1 [Euryarchaeota archaeon]HOB38288.1 50S ribosomal protein P1 [Methanomassiliicoccaceae archaeon]HQA20729.1 50S ribosomal protein P1 [Methanomassiliicoccaceae archaeon]HQD88106.1 50S ribosomal protein P1 [Methanomassiliicoccaceae archaeon]